MKQPTKIKRNPKLVQQLGQQSRRKNILPTTRNPEPPTVAIPLVKVLALVFNMMDSQADKDAGPEMLAECVGKFTQAEVEYFVLHQVTKLPGYNVREALRILDCLTRWRERYFS